jgi:site-specific DNA recombinase
LVCGHCHQGMVCQRRSNKSREYRYYICKTYHKFGRNACSQANVNAHALEDEILSMIRSKLDKLPRDLFMISVNKEKAVGRLQKVIKTKQMKKEKRKKDQVDIFNQRDLFEEETYQQQMREITRQIQVLDTEVKMLQKQIETFLQQIEESSSLEDYIEEFKRINLEDKEMMRVLFHELIKRITLTDQHLDIEYRYDFQI